MRQNNIYIFLYIRSSICWHFAIWEKKQFGGSIDIQLCTIAWFPATSRPDYNHSTRFTSVLGILQTTLAIICGTQLVASQKYMDSRWIADRLLDICISQYTSISFKQKASEHLAHIFQSKLLNN